MTNAYKELSTDALRQIQEENQRRAQDWLGGTHSSHMMASTPASVAKAARKEIERRSNAGKPRNDGWWITQFIVGGFGIGAASTIMLGAALGIFP